MNEKRYSVFISSTYEDLKDERRAVQDTVIMAGDFPVQMESFPATDEAAFDLIKSLLNKCDYYILIIGGRYGSISDDGLSYTHKEFQYAKSHDIPVFVMLHSDRGKISADKTEPSDEGKKRLEEFIVEASDGRTHKKWSTVGELQANVLAALVNAKQTKPRVGWVRGDAIASVDALEQLNEVRKENANFRDLLQHSNVDISLPQLPDLNAVIDIDFMSAVERGQNRGSSGSVRTRWMTIFPVFYDNLLWEQEQNEDGYSINENGSCIKFASALLQELSDDDTRNSFRISEYTFNTILSYFIELGLMMPIGSEAPFTDFAHQVARRQRFADIVNPRFVLKRGKIEVFPLKPSMFDEIPF